MAGKDDPRVTDRQSWCEDPVGTKHHQPQSASALSPSRVWTMNKRIRARLIVNRLSEEFIVLFLLYWWHKSPFPFQLVAHSDRRTTYYSSQPCPVSTSASSKVCARGFCVFCVFDDACVLGSFLFVFVAIFTLRGRSTTTAIPAEFHMISGSHDSQTSADVYNTGKFQLPDPAVRFCY